MEVIVVTTLLPPTSITVRIGTPGKSVYSGMPMLLDFHAPAIGASSCFKTFAEPGYLDATQNDAVYCGVSKTYSSVSYPLIVSFLPVGLSFFSGGGCLASSNLLMVSAAAFICSAEILRNCFLSFSRSAISPVLPSMI